ncbi:uncharacterized protein RCC_08863 [Ramularia collo-cygni]|uniref:Uncharacterized protein n=1 Tax=Ramularia collo-cygni TaxID=112498 RepID=A0A2D3V588_9PEZI|nr:uncharacterized protein RCC_08863 [Ramularia collo-cygni]CZT23153.1 uncharacterized protein RCC_08863 [Ramularia collo-cygni]
MTSTPFPEKKRLSPTTASRSRKKQRHSAQFPEEQVAFADDDCISLSKESETYILEDAEGIEGEWLQGPPVGGLWAAAGISMDQPQKLCDANEYRDVSSNARLSLCPEKTTTLHFRTTAAAHFAENSNWTSSPQYVTSEDLSSPGHMPRNGYRYTNSFGAASSVIEETGFGPPQCTPDPCESKCNRGGAINQ